MVALYNEIMYGDGMNINDLSETGVNTVITGILEGCESYLKANRKMKGPLQDEESFKESYEFFAVLRKIRQEMLRAQTVGLPLRENILIKYVQWLNTMDEEGQIGCGWREEFGLEIFR